MRMKKIFSAVLALSVICGASTVNMYSPESAIVANAGSDYDDGEEYTENGLTFSVYPDKAVVIYCERSKEGAVEIPAEVKGVPVTVIAAESFYTCKNLTSVTIPDGVIEIEEVAFYGCSKLTSVEIPASVTKLGYSAFYNCYALEEISIKNPDMEIGEGAFDGTKWLQNNITDVEENGISFRIYPDHAEVTGCNEKSAEIPDTINDVKVTAIQSFGSADAVVIPASVKTISSQALGMYCSLDKITVDEGNESFTAKDDVLFDKDMTKIVYYPASKPDTSYEIPDTVTTVSGVFSYCNNLKAVTIPNSVKILKNSFYNCESLETVTIPDSVTELESDFNHCTSLKTVNIPASVKSFGPNGSFSDCPELKLVIDEKNEHFSVSDGLVLSKDNGILVFALEEAKNAEEITIPDGTKIIGYGLFSDFTELKKINFPDTIERIGDRLCDGCKSLESVTLPESVCEVGWNSFVNCSSLSSVTILNPDCFIECGNYDDEMPFSNSYKVYTGKIVGYDNSTAQKYAEKFDLTFESLGAAPTNTAIESGDLNDDGKIDANDATLVLVNYSLLSTGEKMQLTESQQKAADVNGDGKIDSSDATTILQYYSYLSTGGKDSFADFMASQK